ncbi:P-loop ATPase, Sll1717 family [Chromobacterium vaccinii]|uniref:P-loop ATPase, Sll1717 family n=1 Tax=Chromobacterium vaccinii TaxID=1108595 RepID=UPI0031D2C0F3
MVAWGLGGGKRCGAVAGVGRGERWASLRSAPTYDGAQLTGLIVEVFRKFSSVIVLINLKGVKMLLLDEIRDNWKLDAKTENGHRYFYHINEVDKIKNGKRSYVIGRKGTGKTAISEHIASVREYDVFSEKLSFKNFPFNELYNLKNAGYTAPNQYITLWKYIIYSHICKMMSRNESVDASVRDKLKAAFSPEPINSLQRWIKKWTAHDFSLTVFGVGGKMGFKENVENNSWIQKVDILESVIDDYIDNSSYYILFDELDEDYKNIIDPEQRNNYTHLLTGLFKAVQDIKSIFREGGRRVYPVIFLRDDIYSIITDPDKTKWDDFKIELDWSRDRIKELLAFRISRAVGVGTPLMDFKSAWNKLFLDQSVFMGHMQNKSMTIFDFIERSTHLRPRDFVRYIHSCAENTPVNFSRISAKTVKDSDKAFSNYLKRELVDEIHGVIPDIQSILDIISQIRKQAFSEAEFREIFEKKKEEGSIVQSDPVFILRILFLFSIIGNQPKQKNQTVFRYLNKDAELNFSENFVVHRGLYKALQIM